MVMGQAYTTKDGKYLKPTEVEKTDDLYVEKATQEPVAASWEKMSKSKFNGVDPSEMMSAYSTDTIRLIILADVAPTSQRNWTKDSEFAILVYCGQKFLSVWIPIGISVGKRNPFLFEVFLVVQRELH